MLKYSGACNFYYRGKRCVPLQGLTWSSIARFGSRRCFCTLELATSTIEAEGGFLCGSVTRARSHAPAVPRFGSERCICTLELATSISGLQGVFLGRGSAIVTVSPDLHLFH